MQTVLSGGKYNQIVWMYIYNTDFLDALTGGDVSGNQHQQQQQQQKIRIVNCFSIEASSKLLHQSQSTLLHTGADIHGEVPNSYL
jgi:hypothetical protein